MIPKLLPMLIVPLLLITGTQCSRVASAAEREQALRREINRGGGVAANAHELVVLFNERQQRQKFLFIFTVKQASYLRKDIALVDYGYPVSAAEIKVEGGTLKVVIPELRPVGVNRFIDQSFTNGPFVGNNIEQEINATLQQHIRESRYRCDILYSTTRTYFETLARKYGYTLDFSVDDATCKNTPVNLKTRDAADAVTEVVENAQDGATQAGRVEASLLGRVVKNIFGR